MPAATLSEDRIRDLEEVVDRVRRRMADMEHAIALLRASSTWISGTDRYSVRGDDMSRLLGVAAIHLKEN